MNRIKQKLTFDEMVDLEADSLYNMDIEVDEYEALYDVDYYTKLKKDWIETHGSKQWINQKQ